MFLLCDNSFLSASTYISHLILIIALLFPFYRWGHRVSEKISDFLRVTQLIDWQTLIICLLVHNTTLSLWCRLTDICLKWLLVTDAVVISGEISSPPLFSVSHRSQPQQPSQPQRTLLQHVAQSQTATQTSVVVKSIPASSPGAITHIMQQVVSLLFLPTFYNCLFPKVRFSFISYKRRNDWIEEWLYSSFICEE